MSITKTLLILLVVVALISGCAQVPKESITLSETVGRDVVAIQKSHRHLVNLHFDKLERDANKFIDDVYAPYQIQKTLVEFKGPLSKAIADAAEEDASGRKQKKALALLEVYLTELHKEIESYRAKQLAPLKAQRAKVLTDLDDAYTRVLQANSAVTGYLASIAKVTDLQNDLLAKLGVPDLQQQVADKAVALSSQIADLQRKANEERDKLKEAIDAFEVLMASLRPKP